jgi:general L-amino acid transport system permease protein
VAGIFLSNRGIKFPTPLWEPAQLIVLAALALAVTLWFLGARRARLRRDAGGGGGTFFWPGLGLALGLPVIAFIAAGAPLEMEVPVFGRLNFRGGGSLSPEFAALLIGLSVYTASFIAEIIRGGVLSVAQGQKEAARALGLNRAQALRLIILPQALRVIVPPLTNQYLNLTKNSSLAVAIGYPDLVSVANTSISQTGQAIEGIAIIMLVYLIISLGISALMNAYNRRIARTELGQ